MVSISSLIKKLGNELNVDEMFKNIVDSSKSNTTKLLANRDGDFFKIKCPKCKTREINKDNMICKNGHIFSLYHEDGIVEETEENKNKILGDDLVKGMDAHGHLPYIYHAPEDKTLVYLRCWEDEDFTIERALTLCQELYDSIEKNGLRNIPHTQLLEVNMSGGRYKPGFGWPIKTWPKLMITKKWFILRDLLKNSPWSVNLMIMDRI